MATSDNKSLEQREFLKGSQRFELTKEAGLDCCFRRFTYTNQYRVPLADIEKDAVHTRALSVKWFVVTAVFVGIAFLFLPLLSKTRRPEDTAAVIAPAVVFLIAGLACLYQALKFKTNTLTFYNRHNGQPLFGIWFEKPNKLEFDDFVSELRAQIQSAQQALPFVPHMGSLSDEIAKLKVLLDKGVLTPAEFEKAKVLVIEAGQSKRIGF